MKVDGEEVATKNVPGTIPAILTIDETLDIGSDTRTPVDDADYQVPFRFTGTINKVSFKLGPSELMPEDPKAAQKCEIPNVRLGSLADLCLGCCDVRLTPINTHSNSLLGATRFPVSDKKFPVPIAGNSSIEAACFNEFVQAGRDLSRQIPCILPDIREFRHQRRVRCSLPAQPP